MDDDKWPLVSVQILNWNRKEETTYAINSVLQQTYPNIEIVVVDNGSSDGSIEHLKQLFGNSIRYVLLDKNYGCPGGRNRGIDDCKGQFIFYCDNDGVLHPRAVENAMKILLPNKDCGIVTGEVLPFERYDDIDVNIRLSDELYESNTFQGGICCHRKCIYSIVGRYPDDYMYGGEEEFLSLKLFELTKYKVLKSKSIVLWHRPSTQRNRNFDRVRGFQNTLITATSLFPVEIFISYFIYYLVRYPFFFYRFGFLKFYFTSFPKLLGRVAKALQNRNAVSRKTYKKFRRLLHGISVK